jgi:hypothetical protein
MGMNFKQKIMTKEITAQDVAQVAIDLGMDITIGQVNQVLEMCDSEADNDPTATWNLIVENCLYNLQN